MRILCIDDDVFVRDSLYKKGLEKFLPNDDICTAEDGEQAVAAIDKQSFDVVITDMKMPGLSGLDVLKHVKEQSPETEVIIVTGVASIQTAVEAIQIGARDYIEKPISIDLLIEKIEYIRDYRSRVNEAEEFRLAKEACEQEAGAIMHQLEMQNQQLKKVAKETIVVLQKGDDANDEERRQLIDKLEALLNKKEN